MNDRPLILPGAEVAVSCASVPPTREALDVLWTLLDDAERERARRFAFETDTNLFVTAHALLRYVLWQSTGISNWQFSVNQFGKPELDPPYGNPRLRFNLSHSASLAVCATCHGYDIGVDVEAIDDDFQFDEVAAHYFTPHECSQLASCPLNERSAAFLRIWTLKEALLKASGHGFSRPPSDFEIVLNPLTLSDPAVHATGADQWHIEQRKLSARHWASIAVRHSPGTAILVRWRSVTALEIAAGLSHKSK